MNESLVLVIILLAAVVQSISGFGSGLVAMSLLPGIIDIRLAAPLVAAVSIIVNATLAIYYRQAFNLHTVSRLTIASLIAIPLGVLALQKVEESFILTFLGVVIVSYALYSLLELRLPKLNSPNGLMFLVYYLAC